MNQEKSIRLIMEFSKYPVLWNSKDPDYHYRTKRDIAWEEISKTMNIPVPTLKTKMTVLMGTYRSEKSREKKSRATAQDPGEIYTSRWYGYKYFDFMTDKETPVGTVNPILNEGSCDIPHASPSVPIYTPQQEYTANVNDHPFRPQKRKRVEDDRDAEVLDKAVEVLKASNHLSTDPYYTYCANLTNELRKYDQTTLVYVKKAISDILFEADVGIIFNRYSKGSPFRNEFPSATSSPPSSLAGDTPGSDENDFEVKYI